MKWNCIFFTERVVCLWYDAGIRCLALYILQSISLTQVFERAWFLKKHLLAQITAAKEFVKTEKMGISKQIHRSGKLASAELHRKMFILICLLFTSKMS